MLIANTIIQNRYRVIRQLGDPLRLAYEVNKKVGVDIASVLNRAMAIGRNQRFATAGEMRHALLSVSSFTSRHRKAKTPEALSTIVGPPPTVRLPQQKAKPRQSTTGKAASPKEPGAIESTVASPVAASFTSQQEPASLLDVPSTTLFEQPVGNIDRFAVARKVGFFLMLLIIVLVILGLVSALKG